MVLTFWCYGYLAAYGYLLQVRRERFAQQEQMYNVY
jgi:hypothetical protein